jgi:hypothetical protein
MPETAREQPGTGNNARRIGILFKSNFVEIIMEYDVKWSLAVSVNVQVM